MPKYEIEYAKFVKIQVDVESLQAAKDLSYIIDDEDIVKHTVNVDDYAVWSEAKEVR